MHVRILGSAAGGGFPQWNCACANCRSLRAGKFAGKPRSQAQIAVSEDGRSWFLLGASPDLRHQIESCRELHPLEGPRSSPISGVVLASADIDHVLGLLLLRELQPLNVYGTSSVLRILRSQNSMFRMLNRVANQVNWMEQPPGEDFSLGLPSGENSGLRCRLVPVSSHFPAYVNERSGLSPLEAVAGYMLTSGTGKTLAYLPNVAAITDEIRSRIERADLVLFDGTFFSDDELIRVQGSGQRACEMGHVPVGGEDGSLQLLSGIGAGRKMYIHINNTNPMLDESGAEYQAIRKAGWELAEDGWQGTL